VSIRDRIETQKIFPVEGSIYILQSVMEGENGIRKTWKFIFCTAF